MSFSFSTRRQKASGVDIARRAEACDRAGGIWHFLFLR